MGEQSRLTFKYLDEERVVSLTEGNLRIGRHEENDLVLDNPYISRFHVEIISEGSRHLIRDLVSTSGTFANGERITQRRLRNGDRIRLGRARGIEFVFMSDDTNVNVTDSDDLKPVRIISPDETMFLNSSRLPPSGDLGNDTIERLRALYQVTGDLLTAHSTEDLSDRLAAFIHRTIKADRCAVLLWNSQRGALEVSASCGLESLGFTEPWDH
jgi:pSer/pThr/pTyr-binding forkhead associated (FHA) protein